MRFRNLLFILTLCLVSGKALAKTYACSFGVKSSSETSYFNSADQIESYQMGVGVIFGQLEYKIICKDKQNNTYMVENSNRNLGFVLGVSLQMNSFKLRCRGDQDITGVYRSYMASSGTGITASAAVFNKKNSKSYCYMADLGGFGVGAFLTLGENRITQLEITEVLVSQPLFKCYRHSFKSGPYAGEFVDMVPGSTEFALLTEETAPFLLSKRYVLSYKNGYCPFGSSRR